MLSNSPEYSQAEYVLIEHFDMTRLARSILPGVLYTFMAVKAFTTDDRSPYADALRRAMLAFERGGIYRLTPEWDDLISIVWTPFQENIDD